MTDPIRIDVWSDIACPWCYIGKRNLEAGLRDIESDENAPQVEVTFHSYELSPDTPVDFDGDELDFLVDRKGLDRPQVRQMLDNVTEVAAKAGLEYHFDTVKHTNTVKAHELLHAAKAVGRQHEMAERLMSAYFVEGRHVGRVDDLVDLAAEVGLDPAEMRAALEDERYVADVRADQAQAAAYGINGVPFFVIDGKYGVSGAQPPEAFSQIARQVWAERAAEAAEDSAAVAG
ncbi:DsbA family oxidoreductase [Microbacterium sp. cx-55]|uniref:DsbA family oxidoreductase n=1 Tax=unclassified Microbacterium TaxID=2609290 RepID=UPI001CC066DF|nr:MULTISPECIES: DsbA family oxidoreductase [unclassified Microbacterium]MBZ4486259.1 DsbA family oxidoreductase [Microbacterium sp. cx-55]MCC4907249.1 DsbA family oxidoreductase [Microbacterium sp. cx-59]UGB33876.1 DsbA family oxidoreductase [Microbacterium sp. cx-55]